MSNCKCHSVPYVNEYDSICRVTWAKYEALLFFMEKGLNKKDAEQCVNNLQVSYGIETLRDELNRIIEATIKEFQLKCRATLSKEKGESVYNSFVYKHKGGKEKRKKQYDTKKTKRTKKPMYTKGIVKRPICVVKGCVHLAKKRYYKGEHKSYSLYCEKNKGHSVSTPGLWKKK